ncbi:reverse transcriptase family protein [Lactiplantibacillus plantarum]|uniref:reverse transcriptase family protein n=2 Tax=Lactiplantibacillus plantarum TaxID=1590 RepID=UPI000B5A4B57|nr:reverse transcriptase family protein [Lactiplantibacillus plantarum]
MQFTTCKLYGIQSKRKLSYILKTSLASLKNVDLSFQSKKFYQQNRLLTNPSEELKVILQRITKYLFTIGIPEYEFGGIKDRSFVTNVEMHVGHGFVLRTDIRHFFPNTHYGDVYVFFHEIMNMSVDCATIMAKLTTYRCNQNYRSLPQGYPTSPILSLFSYLNMFEEINTYAVKNGFTFTAYYDDITISSKRFIGRSHLRVIIHILKKYGFQAHPQKTKLVKISKNSSRIKITGLLLQKDETLVPKKLYKKLHVAMKNIDSALKQSNSRLNKADAKKIVQQARGCIAAINTIGSNDEFQGYSDRIRQLEKRCYY